MSVIPNTLVSLGFFVVALSSSFVCVEAIAQCTPDDINYWRDGGGFFEFDEKFREVYGVASLERSSTLYRANNVLSEYSEPCRVCAVQYADCVDEYCGANQVDDQAAKEAAICNSCNTGITCGGNPSCNARCLSFTNTNDFFGVDCTNCRNQPQVALGGSDSCLSKAETCFGWSLSTCVGCSRPVEEFDWLPVIMGSVVGVLAMIVFGRWYWLRKTSKGGELPEDLTIDEEIAILENKTPHKKKLPDGEIDLDAAPGTYTDFKQMAANYVGNKKPGVLPVATPVEDLQALGHFPVVSDVELSQRNLRTETENVNLPPMPPPAQHIQSPAAQHIHLPNQLMEDTPRKDSDDESIPRF